MDANCSNSSKSEGNSKPQTSPAKRWVFTCHKQLKDGRTLTDDQLCSICSKINAVAQKALVSHERGEEDETPHLQGFIKFKIKCRPFSHFKDICNWIHWKLAKGSDEDQLTYISKETEPFLIIGYPKPVKVIDPSYWWQKEILNIIKYAPNDRLIYWYWSEAGNVGKTSFCKYLSVKHDAIALSGKAADMRNGVIDYVKNKGICPELVCIPIPRSFDSTYLSYEGIENIKDMYFYSGKYEGGMVCGNPPHLFVFSNHPPNEEKMSSDRWVIRNIDQYPLL